MSRTYHRGDDMLKVSHGISSIEGRCMSCGNPPPGSEPLGRIPIVVVHGGMDGSGTMSRIRLCIKCANTIGSDLCVCAGEATRRDKAPTKRRSTSEHERRGDE
jgi:hypothetical protein